MTHALPANTDTFTALKIDVTNYTISEIELPVNNDIEPYYPHLNCRIFTVGGYLDDDGHDCVYVDDEGLFVPNQRFFYIEGQYQPLAGNAIIVGTDDQGRSIAPKITLDELKKITEFIDDPKLWLITGGQRKLEEAQRRYDDE